MRPVRLDLNGFASFRDPVTVDFADADYFALVGPTGSGKSTVIDAITFALYGSVHRWDDAKIVKLALAPTATRATVRLLFDIGPTRYVVAREVRRSGATYPHKSRLERLADPSGTGEPDEVTEVLAHDSAVKGAVEQLLGLTFEQFCTCVVLPQGDFAEFLHANRSERQKILLKLLGAAHYDAVARAANSRAANARQRADVLTGELGTYADATEEAEKEAAGRADALAASEKRVTAKLVPALSKAGTTLADAQRDLESLQEEQRSLAAVSIPVDVAHLDQQVIDARTNKTAAAAAERMARNADTAARAALAAAPARAPLQQTRRDYAEHDTLTVDLPAACDAGKQAKDALDAATTATVAADKALEQARTTRDAADHEARAAEETLASRRRNHASLAGIALPDGLDSLGAREQVATAGLHAATVAFADADQADQAARAALRQAELRGPLEAALTAYADLAAANARCATLALARDEADTEHTKAVDARTMAEAALADVQQQRDAAGLASHAAALREHLATGQPCPVCEQTVTALPMPLDDPELVAAAAALTSATHALRVAQQSEHEAVTNQAKAAAAHDAVRDRVTELTELVADAPGDAEAVRARLQSRDGLEKAEHDAGDTLVAARTARAAAQQTVDGVAADLAAARRLLHATRDPLVPLSAPTLDDTDVIAAWTQLVAWGTDAAAIEHKAVTAATAAAKDRANAHRATTKAFQAAEKQLADARQTEQADTITRERAVAAVTRLEHRLRDLTAELDGKPSDETAREQLAEIDALEAAAAEADRKQSLARDALDALDVVLDELTVREEEAWQDLRASRDPLVSLGAPELTGNQLLAAWTTFANWAEQQAVHRTTAVAASRDAVTAAQQRQDALHQDLAAELTAHAILVPAGDLTATAGPAVAAAAERARGEVSAIADRRAAAVRLKNEMETAATEAAVAKALGDLLSANNFQRWLAASALDTLLVDASAGLMALSGGQFELTHDDGAFVVVDHADADSQRPVKTLSGGETFQASLALALALSSQLSTMGAEGAVQLDSIFLDEGFGSLDETTLETVAATLERLASSDRMVGVITHVPALADRIPVRYLVNRDERTSTIVREAL